MTTIGIILANALAVGLLVLVAHALPPLPLWERTERPYACAVCDLTFSDVRQAAWHQSQHPATLCAASCAETAEPASVVAGVRRSEA